MRQFDQHFSFLSYGIGSMASQNSKQTWYVLTCLTTTCQTDIWDLTLILWITLSPADRNLPEKSRLTRSRPANITTCWCLLFGLLLFSCQASWVWRGNSFSKWSCKVEKRCKQHVVKRTRWPYYWSSVSRQDLIWIETDLLAAVSSRRPILA